MTGVSHDAGTTGPDRMVLTDGEVESEVDISDVPVTGRNPSSNIGIGIDMELPLASRSVGGGSNPMTERSLALTCGGLALSLVCASAASEGTWLASSSSLNDLDFSLDDETIGATAVGAVAVWEDWPERDFT